MASELTVQTIKGPLSGDNANKIIIPAGQTLDTSAAAVSGLSSDDMPAGSVVQVAEYNINVGTWNTQSTSYVSTPATVNITPKFANSKMIIHVFGSIHWGGTTGHGRGQIRKNGGTLSSYTNDDLLTYKSGDSSDRGHTHSSFTVDTNVGTTEPVTYAYYVRADTGSDLLYFYRNIGIVVEEIKQ
jgi:hypothetical protein